MTAEVHPIKPVRPGDRLTLSVEEAAATLGISRALAYAAAKHGQLPVIYIGQRILIPSRPCNACSTRLARRHPLRKHDDRLRTCHPDRLSVRILRSKRTFDN